LINPNPNTTNQRKNPHRPTLENKRRPHNKIGLKVAYLVCGLTHGAGAPLVARLGPNIVRAVQIASLWSVLGVWPRFNVPGGCFGAFHERMKHYPKEPPSLHL